MDRINNGVNKFVTSPLDYKEFPSKTTFYSKEQTDSIFGFNKPNFENNLVTTNEIEQKNTSGNISLFTIFSGFLNLFK